jgi:hypothetical protein
MNLEIYPVFGQAHLATLAWESRWKNMEEHIANKHGKTFETKQQQF